MERQEGRDEGGEDGRRAQMPQHGQPLAELGAGEAAHGEQHRRHQDVGRHLAGQDEGRDQHEEDDEDRQRDDADPEIDDPPPALGPEARFGLGMAGERGVGHGGTPGTWKSDGRETGQDDRRIARPGRVRI